MTSPAPLKDESSAELGEILDALDEWSLLEVSCTIGVYRGKFYFYDPEGNDHSWFESLPEAIAAIVKYAETHDHEGRLLTESNDE